MKFLPVFLLALTVVACSGSKPVAQTGEPAATAPIPATPPGHSPGVPLSDAAIGDAEFEMFVMSSFNWELMGNDVLVLRKEGKSSYTAAVVGQEGTKRRPVMVPRWHTLEWDADPSKIEILESKLKAAKFHSLDALYIDRKKRDGQSKAFILFDSDGTKRVECSNEFPEAISELRRFLYEEFIAPRHTLLETVPGLSREAAEVQWKQYESTP